MKQTKEKKPATVQDVSLAMQNLMRNDLIGWVTERGEGEFSFSLPSGKHFMISVKEMEK